MKILKIPLLVVLGLSIGIVVFVYVRYVPVEQLGQEQPSLSATSTIISASEVNATERFSAQVDRVVVVFEQWDYTRYRLQTNDLVRAGELNTERGFENDENATVYILNWQKPIGEQIRYIRLTAEPTNLYMLGNDNKVIRGSQLKLQ